ncbi:MAG: class I SAM-dependent methyltransferase [Gammaproteobacteria bacterium]|nr:class I SAM-dependent methyltransferase [Gammaproteobacteria bacterium]
MKPFAESCEQNKHAIFSIIKQEFSHSSNVLEIGSGTGQHAIFFAAQLRHLTWQPSEQNENIPGILEWLKDYPYDNIPPPLTLNVTQEWPSQIFDGIFSANTAHIMSWPEVKYLFKGVGNVLGSKGKFCLYGPFNYNKQFTSESNARFDRWLKDQNPTRGIRDFDDLNKVAKENNLIFERDIEMPENNRILIWKKT